MSHWGLAGPLADLARVHRFILMGIGMKRNKTTGTTPRRPATVDTGRNRTRRTLGAAAASAALIAASMVLPASASASENFRGTLTFPTEPVVECDGGVQIGLGFDVAYAYHLTYAGEELVRERLIMNYTGYFENLDTGDRSAPVRGTGNTVTDFVKGTRTISGTGRSMTMPGLGKVLHEAGHMVVDHESGEVLFQKGPLVNEATPEGAKLVCQVMGLTGGEPLEPPDVHE